jgi:hypothetical protein
MNFRLLVPFAITAAAAIFPAAASAQQTAEEAMRSIASRAHFHIRQTELCRSPDEGSRKETADRILAWVNAEAARVGVSQAALAEAAQDGADQAESRLGNTPSADECATGAQHFATFLADTINQRKAAQTVLLGRNTRAHFQMRTAQLCKQPDDARQKEIASKLNEWLAAAAAEAGVLPDALAKNAADAVRSADAEHARDPSPKRCQQNASSLISLSGG